MLRTTGGTEQRLGEPESELSKGGILANFDADVRFVPEGVSCHFLGVTPRFAILLEFISGSYTCTTTSGSVVQTGTFGATRRRV
jgi:hypothetical protein